MGRRLWNGRLAGWRRGGWFSTARTAGPPDPKILQRHAAPARVIIDSSGTKKYHDCKKVVQHKRRETQLKHYRFLRRPSALAISAADDEIRKFTAADTNKEKSKARMILTSYEKHRCREVQPHTVGFQSLKKGGLGSTSLWPAKMARRCKRRKSPEFPDIAVFCSIVSYSIVSGNFRLVQTDVSVLFSIRFALHRVRTFPSFIFGLSWVSPSSSRHHDRAGLRDLLHGSPHDLLHLSQSLAQVSQIATQHMRCPPRCC